jgi:hypothetical protein
MEPESYPVWLQMNMGPGVICKVFRDGMGHQIHKLRGVTHTSSATKQWGEAHMTTMKAVGFQFSGDRPELSSVKLTTYLLRQ